MILTTDAKRTIPTGAFKLALGTMEMAFSVGRMGGIYGPAGVGKSFSVVTFLSRVQNDGARTAFVNSPVHGSARQLGMAILKQLTGYDLDVEASRVNRMLEAELKVPGKIVVAIDEAQRLQKDGLEYVRYLWDEVDHRRRYGGGETELVFLFAGGRDTDDAIAAMPMFADRVRIKARLEHMQPAEAVAILCAHDPEVFGSLEPQTIEWICQTLHGSVRAFGTFIDLAHQAFERLGKKTMTLELAEALLEILVRQGPDE